MRDALSRRALAAALLTAPFLAIIFICVADAGIQLLAVAVALLAMGLAWLLGRSLARRVRALTAFTDGLPDAGAAKPACLRVKTRWANWRGRSREELRGRPTC